MCERASVRVRTTYDGPRGPLPNTILAIEGIVVEMWVGERVASIVAYSRSIHCPPCHWRRARLPGRRFGVSPRGVDDIQGAEVTAVEIIYIMIPASVHSCHWYYLYCCYYQIIITPGHTTHTHRDVPATGRHPAGRVSPPQMAQLTLPRPAGRLPTFGPSLPPSISDTASRASSHNKSMYVLPPCQTQLTPAPASNTHSASQSQSAQTIS